LLYRDDEGDPCIVADQATWSYALGQHEDSDLMRLQVQADRRLCGEGTRGGLFGAAAGGGFGFGAAPVGGGPFSNAVPPQAGGFSFGTAKGEATRDLSVEQTVMPRAEASKASLDGCQMQRVHEGGILEEVCPPSQEGRVRYADGSSVWWPLMYLRKSTTGGAVGAAREANSAPSSFLHSSPAGEKAKRDSRD